MKSYQDYIILLLLCVGIFFFHLDVLHPDIMEMRNFITAREMIQEGNWWFTTLNLEPRLEKPPLPTWLTAGSVLAFGDLNNYYALRLPAAIMSTLLAFFFYAFNKELTREPKLPIIGSIVLVTSFLIAQQGRINSWDIYTHTFMMGSIWLFTRAVLKNSWKPIIGATLFMGASVLSKGPVSLYALWIPFIIAFGMINGKIFYKENWPKILVVLLVGVLIGISWNIHMYLAQEAVSEYVIDKETASWTNKHTRSIFYYLHFPLFIGIWVVFYISTFFYKYAKPKLNQFGNYKFLLGWGLFAILLLSIIPTKKERYLLPALIPMALATTYMIYAIYKSQMGKNGSTWDSLIIKIHTVLLGLLSLLSGVLIIILKYKSLTWLTIVGCILLIIAGCLLFIALKKNRLTSIFNLSITLMLIVTIFMIPQLSNWIYDNYDYKNISEMQHYEELNGLDVYIENTEIDINILWPAGRATQPMIDLDYSNTANFPITLITINPLEVIMADSVRNKLEVEFFGIHDLFRKESKYKTRIYKVGLKN